MPTTPQFWFHVAPRYTSGSPALVGESIARKVASQEHEAYWRTMEEEIYGKEEKERADELGLGHIAYATREVGRNVWIVDLIEGMLYVAPSKEYFGVSREEWMKIRARYRRYIDTMPARDAEKIRRVLGWPMNHMKHRSSR